MFMKDLKKCNKIIAGDNTILCELLSPLNENVSTRYSLAHATVKPGEITHEHRLKSSEVYYILQGEGEMYVDYEKKKVLSGQVIYIPPKRSSADKKYWNLRTGLSLHCGSCMEGRR